MLTKPVKSALNAGVPVVAAVVTAILLLKAKKDWKFTLIVSALVLVGAWVAVSQLTKIIAAQGPAPVPTGGGCDNYDPTALVDALHEDIYCTFCERDRELYTTLLGLSDCQIIKVYNDWNKRYYSEDNESLPVAIRGESHAIDYYFEQQQTDLAKKFATLNLQ